MGGSDLVLAVDIGTTKACALLAKIREPQEPEILGVGLTPCSGLNKGAVVDLEATSTAISEAVEKCLAMAGTRYRSAVIGIAGSFIRSFNARGTVVVASRGRGVTQHDMDAAVRDAIQKTVPTEMETIHAVPREYRLDDIGGIQDPLRMHGSMLEVDVHLVAASRAGLRNVRRAAQHAGLRIECVALEPLASSLSVLDGAEKSAGVVMIDIGGGTTDVAVFVDGTVRHSEVIPVGGDYITKDISTYFVTPFDQAEDLKIRYGGASTGGIAPDEQIEVKRTKKSHPILVPRRELNFVIEARVEQVVSEVKRSILESGFMEAIRGGIVLTGGTANLDGIRRKANQGVGLEVEIGYPDGVTGYSEIVRNPIYATAVGLVHFGIAERRRRRSSGPPWAGPWDWLRRFFRDTF